MRLFFAQQAMVLTIPAYKPITKISDLPPGGQAHPAGSGSIEFKLRVLTRYGEVVIDFDQFGDLISYQDSLSTEGVGGNWTIKMKASLCNEELLKKVHPGYTVEIYCARNDDPLIGVIADPSQIKRIDTTPDLPDIATVQTTVPAATAATGGDASVLSGAGTSQPTSAFAKGFLGVNNDRQKYLLAVTAIAEGKANDAQSQLDTAVSMGNRLQSGKWGNSIDKVILAPGQFEATWRWGFDGVKDEQSAISALQRARGYGAGSAKKELDAFLAASNNPAQIKSAVQHVRGATDYRGPSPVTVKHAGDYQRNNSDNFYIPPGDSSASVSQAEAAKFQQAAGQYVGGVTPAPATQITPKEGEAPAQTTTQTQIQAQGDVIGPEVKPIEDPYLDKCPHLLMRGVITDYGRSSDKETLLSITGESYGKIYKDAFVLADNKAPELASQSTEVRLMTQVPLGVSLIYYQLLRNWVEQFWGTPTGYEARTRPIPFPPNYLTRINNEGSVWSSLQFLAIEGFFHIFVDHTGAIVWEKLPWSAKDQALITGRNWEDLQLLECPSWKILSWSDRISEQGVVNFVRCVPTQQGVIGGQGQYSYVGLVYNVGSIRQYGGPTKRELQFPIGDSRDQYYTSAPLRKQKATNQSFVDLCALESIRWYDRPVQRVQLTVRGESAWRINTRLAITEDWHCVDAKPGEYYISSRSHSINVAQGNWTTSLDLVRDRRTRYLGIGVGDVKVLSAEAVGPDGDTDLNSILKRLETKGQQKQQQPSQQLLDAANDLKRLFAEKTKEGATGQTQTTSKDTVKTKVDPSDPQVRRLLEQLDPKKQPSNQLDRLLSIASELKEGSQIDAVKEIELPPEILVPLVPDEYLFFNRFTAKIIAIGNDPIKWAKENVIPRLGEEVKPIAIVPAPAPNGIVKPTDGTAASGGKPAPFKTVDRIYTASNLYDPTPPLAYDYTLSRGGSGFFGGDEVFTAVPSPVSGKILQAGWSGGYGNRVEVEGSDGITWLFAHFKSIAVKQGDTVTRGQTLGIQNSTGSIRPPGEDGSHIHNEFFKGAQKLGYDTTRPLLREYFRFLGGGKLPTLNGPSP